MRARPFLQLLRAPNLFTVPGDPVCGFLLASHGVWSWRVLPAVVVSLSCYCAGLIINDLADFAEDLRDRPARPLPSGAIPKRTAVVLALFFIALALTAGACSGPPLLILAALLVAEILWYDLMAKKNAVMAPVAMGFCRGLSVMAGAAAVIPEQPGRFDLHPSLAAVAAVTLYIGAVTVLARAEMGNPRIPPLIGALIRGLIFLQAGFCLLAGGFGWVGSVVLLALWPMSRLVAKQFYAS